MGAGGNTTYEPFAHEALSEAARVVFGVATTPSFSLAGAAPHNFWLDETAGIAYFSWYENGIHAVDVSGSLLGELDKQARQVASIQYDAGGVCLAPSGTCSWAPQVHDGFIYVSDLNSGLWVLRPTF